MNTEVSQGSDKAPVRLRLRDEPEFVPLLLVFVGFLAMYVPTYIWLADNVWRADEQGHGPIILAVSLFLLWRMRAELVALRYEPASGYGVALLILAMASYVIGRSQAIIQLEAGSQILTLMALLLLLRGPKALRMAWFPLFFMIFMVPLPGVFVQMVTIPLKSAVSVVVEWIMYSVGYPIARTGVVLTIGQYQLLVADACAGLNSMFTLESLGLLYLNLMGHTSAKRNLTLALLIIPIAFVANVVRVIILVLVTFYFGDAAGQGFIHGFAGMVLFMVGLIMMLGVDGVLGRVLKESP